VGLEVTSAPPHAVVMALDVLDANFVTQGSPAYSNEPILPGDRILEVRLLRCVKMSSGLGHIWMSPGR
jgi:hypothetical protein